MKEIDIIKKGKEVLQEEAHTLSKLSETIDNNFKKIVEEILKSKGRVFVSGIGKSGLIGRKISATLSSTGTPSIFVHPTECFHGDIGVVMKGDIIILMSYSGETEEIIKIIPLLKRIGIKIIAMTANKKSTIAKQSDFLLYTPIEKEACPMNIVPSSSTTAMLAIGDAIAICLIHRRGFNTNDFAKLHPGGNLGRKLLTKVKDLMYKFSRLPLVKDNFKMKDVITEISSKNFGITGVLDKDGFLIGVVTDGDLRRGMQVSKTFLEDKVTKFMGKNPKIISKDVLAVDAIKMMQKNKITHVFVVEKKDEKNKDKIKPVGLLHIHSLLEAKIV
jgi:arabinose-5-phosphate isomerase